MKLRDLMEKKVSAPREPLRGNVQWPYPKMDDLGWTRIGSGSFGVVYEHPKHPGWVFKLVMDDPAYLKFLSFTKNSDNPHFPRVGRTTKIQSHRGLLDAVMIEKLTTNSIPEPSPWEVDFGIRPYVDYYKSWCWINGRNRATLTPEERRIEQEFPQFRRACLEISRFIKQNNRRNPQRFINTDIKDANMMFRGSIPVFTDPVYEQ